MSLLSIYQQASEQHSRLQEGALKAVWSVAKAAPMAIAGFIVTGYIEYLGGEIMKKGLSKIYGDEIDKIIDRDISKLPPEHAREARKNIGKIRRGVREKLEMHGQRIVESERIFEALDEVTKEEKKRYLQSRFKIAIDAGLPEEQAKKVVQKINGYMIKPVKDLGSLIAFTEDPENKERFDRLIQDAINDFRSSNSSTVAVAAPGSGVPSPDSSAPVVNAPAADDPEVPSEGVDSFKKSLERKMNNIFPLSGEISSGFGGNASRTMNAIIGDPRSRISDVIDKLEADLKKGRDKKELIKEFNKFIEKEEKDSLEKAWEFLKKKTSEAESTLRKNFEHIDKLGFDTKDNIRFLEKKTREYQKHAKTNSLLDISKKIFSHSEFIENYGKEVSDQAANSFRSRGMIEEANWVSRPNPALSPGLTQSQESEILNKTAEIKRAIERDFASKIKNNPENETFVKELTQAREKADSIIDSIYGAFVSETKQKEFPKKFEEVNRKFDEIRSSFSTQSGLLVRQFPRGSASQPAGPSTPSAIAVDPTDASELSKKELEFIRKELDLFIGQKKNEIKSISQSSSGKIVNNGNATKRLNFYKSIALEENSGSLEANAANFFAGIIRNYKLAPKDKEKRKKFIESVIVKILTNDMNKRYGIVINDINKFIDLDPGFSMDENKVKELYKLLNNPVEAANYLKSIEPKKVSADNSTAQAAAQAASGVSSAVTTAVGTAAAIGTAAAVGTAASSALSGSAGTIRIPIGSKPSVVTSPTPTTPANPAPAAAAPATPAPAAAAPATPAPAPSGRKSRSTTGNLRSPKTTTTSASSTPKPPRQPPKAAASAAGAATLPPPFVNTNQPFAPPPPSFKPSGFTVSGPSGATINAQVHTPGSGNFTPPPPVRKKINWRQFADAASKTFTALRKPKNMIGVLAVGTIVAYIAEKIVKVYQKKYRIMTDAELKREITLNIPVYLKNIPGAKTILVRAEVDPKFRAKLIDEIFVTVRPKILSPGDKTPIDKLRMGIGDTGSRVAIKTQKNVGQVVENALSGTANYLAKRAMSNVIQYGTFGLVSERDADAFVGDMFQSGRSSRGGNLEDYHQEDLTVVARDGTVIGGQPVSKRELRRAAARRWNLITKPDAKLMLGINHKQLSAYEQKIQDDQVLANRIKSIPGRYDQMNGSLISYLDRKIVEDMNKLKNVNPKQYHDLKDSMRKNFSIQDKLRQKKYVELKKSNSANQRMLIMSIDGISP